MEDKSLLKKILIVAAVVFGIPFLLWLIAFVYRLIFYFKYMSFVEDRISDFPI